ncbi:RluA family pseudouridine synthase [Reinekea forsetii]|nr:RluA family pseudouridine synthase [Reinekea forsetii]
MFDPASDPFVAPPCNEAIAILFEDDDILVINKPSGLLSLSGKNPLNKDSVHYRLNQSHPGIRLLHRLDLGTSGIMLLAKNKAANTALMHQFQQRAVDKVYLAVLDGIVEQSEFSIDLPIAKGEFPVQIVCENTGKPALTKGTVLAIDKVQHSTRVRLTPHTGRTHQLRLHCKAFGHPILGCDIYKRGQSEAKAPRLLLHAHSLCFVHPVNGESMKLMAGCPF